MVSLHAVADLGVEGEELDDVLAVEVLGDGLVVVAVQADVVDVDVVSFLDDVVEGVVEEIVEEMEIAVLVSDCCVDQILLDGDSLLIVNQPQMEGKVSNLTENIIRMGEPITNTHPL